MNSAAIADSQKAPLPRRRPLRLGCWNYTWAWWYFVTFCAFDRRCLFGEIRGKEVVLNRLGEIIEDEWLETAGVRPGVKLDSYVIMPNHIHGIIVLPGQNSVGATRRVAPTLTTGSPVEATRWVAPILATGSLGAIIGQVKSAVTRHAMEAGAWRGGKIWQRGYHDHIIRSDFDLHRIRTYIRNNPLRWAVDEENPARRISRVQP